MTAKEHLKEYVLLVLERMEGRKKARGIEPSFATASEFRAELQGDMEGVMLELEEAGKIHRGPTLNDDYIALI